MPHSLFGKSTSNAQVGFTLAEMVVGMVVLAIAMTLMATLLYPLAERSAQGVHRAKAAQLGQAVLTQLAARRVDISVPVGGLTGPPAALTCCSDNSAVCASGATNPTAPNSWELLDRFDGFNDSANALVGGNQYQDFGVQISISCPSLPGSPLWADGVKLAQVRVTAPNGELFDFAQVRGNF